VVAASLARVEPLAGNHRISVALEADLPVVRVDPHAVAEVVYTLLDNALKYSPAKTTIRVAAARAGDEMIRISV
jgi:two-component system sensor histidine kinase KdpD